MNLTNDFRLLYKVLKSAKTLSSQSIQSKTILRLSQKLYLCGQIQTVESLKNTFSFRLNRCEDLDQEIFNQILTLHKGNQHTVQ